MEQEELSMARGKKHTAEQIVNLLRQVEVGVANGASLPQAQHEIETNAIKRRNRRMQISVVAPAWRAFLRAAAMSRTTSENVSSSLVGLMLGESGLDGDGIGR